MLPLSVPVLAAFAIFQFLWTWNDYLIAVTMIGANQSAAPSTVVIAAQTGQFGQTEHLLTAGAFLQAAVPLACSSCCSGSSSAASSPVRSRAEPPARAASAAGAQDQMALWAVGVEEVQVLGRHAISTSSSTRTRAIAG